MKQMYALAALAGLFVPAAFGANPVVEIKTSKGSIKVELFEDKAPGTVKNFLKYVKDKHYDGTIFHRVKSDFMIQGGGFTKGFGDVTDEPGLKAKEKKTGAPIKNESTNGLSNEKGTIAMARTSKPDSATAQFYINTVDNAFLDKKNARDKVGYCVFGKVVSGMDVVDKIKESKTKSILGGAMANVPVDEVVIESVTVSKK